jgi:hypothetical protein
MKNHCCSSRKKSLQQQQHLQGSVIHYRIVNGLEREGIFTLSNRVK